MPSISPHVGREPKGHRRTVRIIRPRPSLRPATVSLLVGAAAALMLLLLWQLLRPEPMLIAPQRSMDSTELMWKCDAGHVFYAAGHAFGADGLTAAKTCVICGERAFPFGRYMCSVHGPVEVMVRFSLPPDGTVEVAQVRLPSRDWAPRDEGLRCPRCDRPLEYISDPLEGAGAGKRRGAGG